MKRFQDLHVWEKAHQLVLTIYRVAKQFPRDEQYGLVSQMRRAAVSVTANIVEGRKRTVREFMNFMGISEGSLEELKYYMWLARDLGYLSSPAATACYHDAEEIGRMLHGLRTYVSREVQHENSRVR